MKTKIYSILMAIALVCSVSLSSCKDNESGEANAVFASTRSIEFAASDTYPVTLNITSDGDWHVDTPDWITVTPSTGGTGRTEVTVEVSDNLREGTPDRPRKYTLKFIGSKSLGAYNVLVTQTGDKYRDLAPISISELSALEDDDAVMLTNVTVYAGCDKNMVVTDGTNFANVKKLTTGKGEKVELVGSKFDADKLPYIDGEKLTEQGTGIVPSIEATDITDNLDKYSANDLTLVKFTGAFDGEFVKIAGQTNKAQIVDSEKTLDIAQYKGHQVEMTGVYVGTASPVVKIIATDVKDLGLNEVIYFQDDFEWFLDTNILTYESSGKKTSDNVGDNMKSGAYNPQSTTLKDSNGNSIWDLLKNRGYEMYSTSETQAKKSVGVAKCYLKMAVTTYTAKLVLPEMPEAEDGVENVRIKFDWTPMTDGGKGVWDQVEICVEVTTDGVTKVFAVPVVNKSDGLDSSSNLADPYYWTTVDMVLSDIKINKTSRIALRNADPNYPQTKEVGLKQRWFLDNIKVYKPKE